MWQSATLKKDLRQFAVKVRGAVTDCKFIALCNHATSCRSCAVPDCRGVDYTDIVVCDILLSGIYNVEIRRKVLSDPSMLTILINNIICTVKGKESARNAVASAVPQQPAEATVKSTFKS